MKNYYVLYVYRLPVTTEFVYDAVTSIFTADFTNHDEPVSTNRTTKVQMTVFRTFGTLNGCSTVGILMGCVLFCRSPFDTLFEK